MASTVQATTAITLSSLIGVFVGITTATNSAASSLLVSGNNTALATSVKFFAISLCFILAVPAATTAWRDGSVSAAYVERSLNRGSFFHASFAPFVWIFGPGAMLASL